ncbi:PKD-like domain-containing protein [Fulvivirga ligni]|uniref:PKD-like domain-containing protein n=1 Tax=Fulvivirga ligni TaxID=2904246 RepID=UPI001F35BF4C|nr:PKD-like domain-containing protein [Fulvivirga ligni]UII20020.1 gliding motility-associated C-terminal domain-containing protein [Fulvivirga ligni]
MLIFLKRDYFFGFIISVLLFFSPMAAVFGQTGTCADATDFGVINNTSLNCGGDNITRTVTANNTSTSPWTASDNIQATIFWDDGSPNDIVTLTFLNAAIGWTATINHTYPDNGLTCEYNARAQLIVNGTTCTGSDVNDPFDVIVYDELDNPNVGTHDINHVPTTAGAENPSTLEVDICEGDTDRIRLRDNSTYNCTMPTLNNPPTDSRNKEDRWIQFVYGTNETITGDVTIGGVVVSSFPYFGEVIHIGDNTANPLNDETLNIEMPATALAGEFFEVTLRSWNICNPYDNNPDDGNKYDPVGGVFDPTVEPIFGSFPLASEAPVTTTQNIRIINKPPLANANSPVICLNTDLSTVEFQITGGNLSQSTEIRWYDADPNAGGVLLNNPYGNNSNAYPANAGNLGINNSVPGSTSIWATYIQGASNDCESDPVEVTLTIRDDLADPTITTSTPLVCDGETNVSYQIAAAPPAGAKYVWSLGGGDVSFVGGVNEGQNVQLDFNTGVAAGTSTNRTLLVRTEYISAPSCPSDFTTLDITISGGPRAVHSGDVTVCAGNPAADIDWTIAGDGPFDFTYEKDDGTTVTPVVVTGHNSNTFTISPGAPSVETSYEIITMTDANGCTNTAADLGGKAFVRIGTTPPTVDGISVEPAVCDDGGATAVPRVIVDLDLPAGENIEVNYTIDGGSVINRVFTTNANGEIFIDATYADLGNTPGTYVFDIINLEEVSSACNVPINQPFNVIINARPAAPSNPQDGLACSPDVPTATIQVDAPAPGETINWFSTSTGGVSIGTGNIFTPGAAGVYYAENSNANCVSASRTAVTLYEDTPPSAADAGTTPAPFCESFYNLAAVAPASGRGSWSVDGLLYAENFTGMVDGVIVDHDLYGWDRQVNVASFTGPDSYFEVRGQRMTGRDTNDEVVWVSDPIDVTGVPSIDFSMNVSQSGDMEGTGTGRDYIGAYYSIDGGTETLIGTELGGNFGSSNISGTYASGGSSMVIVIRLKTNANDEIINFDNILVRATGTSINIADVNQASTNITGLPVGTTTVTWTVTSLLGACNPTTATVDLERLPPPAVTDPAPEVCEDNPGSQQAEVDLTAYKDAIVGAAVSADRAISYFENAAKTISVADPTAHIVNNTTLKTVYITVENTLTGCTNNGTITFDVVGLPSANDLNEELCEDVLNNGLVDDVDLTFYEAGIIAPALPADRTVSWFTDPSLDPSFAVPTPTDVDAVQDGDVFYALVDNSAAGCSDAAQITFTVNPQPQLNPIQVGGATPASITLCRNGTDPVFFQISGSLNPSSTYQWTLPGTGEFVLESGATLDNFFVPLTFPTSVASPGLPLSVVETTVDGCVGQPNIIDIVVVDIPAKPIIAGNDVVCTSDENITYRISSPVAGSLYTWDVPGALGSIISGQNTDEIIVDIGNTPGNYNITVRETSSSGCISPSADPFPVEVYAQPKMTSVNAVTICSGEAVNTALIFTSDMPTATFEWQVISKSGPVGGTAVGNVGTGNITDVLTNASTSVGQVTYEVVPVGPAPATCDGPSQFVFISIEPEPAVNVAVAESVICNGDNASLQVTTPTVSSNPGDLVFDYGYSTTDAANISGAGLLSGADQPFGVTLSGNLDNSSDEDITVTYYFVPKLNGCGTGDTLRRNVIVEPTPSMAMTNNQPRICNGENIDIDITSPTIPSVPGDLSFDYTTVSTGSTSGTAFYNATTVVGRTFPTTLNGTLINNGDQYITVTFEGIPKLSGCSDGVAESTDVIVEPTPKASITNNTLNICSNDNIDIIINSPTVVSPGSVLTFDYTTVSSNPATISGTAYSTTPVTGQTFLSNLTGTLINSGTDDLTVTFNVTPMINGCAAGPVSSTTVVVEPAPNVFLTNNSPVICDGGLVNIGVTTTTNASDPSKLKFDVSVSSPDITSLLGSAKTPPSNNSFPGSISGNLINTSNSAIEVEYTVTPRIGTCPVGVSKVTKVIVEPTPQANPQELSKVVCDNEYFEIDVLSPTSPTDINDLAYKYTVSSDNPAATGGSAFTARNNLIFGTNKIAGELTNSSNSVITVTFEVTPTLANCSDGPKQIVEVKVNPVPALSLVNNAPLICNEDNVDIAVNLASSSEDDSFYSYTYSATSSPVGAVTGTGMSGGSGAFPSSNIQGQLINSSDQTATVTYEFIPHYAGCTDGVARYATVQVEPTPSVVAVNNSPLICSGGAVDVVVSSVTIPSDPNKLTFNYTVTSDGPIEGSASSGATGRSVPFNINGTLTNPGNNPVNVTYHITPQLSGCANGAVEDVIVVVEPQPVALLNNRTPQICTGGNVDIEVTTPVNSTDPSDLSYDVTVVASGPGVTGSAFTDLTDVPFGTSITGDLINSTDAAITVTYSVTPKLLGCASGQVKNTTVVVDPLPKANITNNGIDLICSGGNVDIDITSPTVPNIPGNLVFDYTVTSSVPGVISGSAFTGGTGRGFPLNIAGTLINSSNDVVLVTYRATPRLANCTSGGFVETTVEVQPQPVLNPIVNTTPLICNEDFVSITVSTPTAPKVDGELTFDYTVVSSNAAVTSGTAYNNGVGGTDEYISTTNDFVINGDLINSSNAFVTVTYTFTPKINGCPSGDPQVTTVQVEPTPELAVNPVSPSPISPICSGDEINIQITNLINPTDRASLTFDVDVQSTDNLVTSGSAFNNDTGLPYPGRITGDLINTGNIPVTVTFTFTPMLHGCVGTPQTLDIQVDPLPGALALNEVACSDVIINRIKAVDLTLLESQVNTNVGSGFTITWFRDSFLNSQIASPTNYTMLDGVPVYAKVVNDATGCVNSAPVTYRINPKPQVSTVITYYDNIYGVSCLGATDGEIQASTIDAIGAVTYELLDAAKVSLGITNTDGHFTNLAAGQYFISVTDANSCQGETIAPVVLLSPFELSGGFVYNEPGGICAGDAPDRFTELSSPFGGTTGGAGYLYQWQFSSDGVTYTDIAGATGAEYQHGTMNTPGTYYFLREVRTPNGCGPKLSNGGIPLEVVVNTIPTGTIDIKDGLANSVNSICEGSPFIVEFNFTNGSEPYTFVYEDPQGVQRTQLGAATSSVFINQAGPADEGTYTLVSVTDRNGCTSYPNATAVLQVVQLDASFSFTESSPQCSPAQFNFRFDQEANVEYRFIWKDGSPDEVIPVSATDITGVVVPHTFTNGSTDTPYTYNITLQARFSTGASTCVQEFDKPIRVYPEIIPNVAASNPIVCSGDEFIFTNTSLGANRHDWRLIDPVSGNVLETFNGNNTNLVPVGWEIDNTSSLNPKPYTVEFTGTNATTGCFETTDFTVQVYKKVVPDFTFNFRDPGIFQAGFIDVDYTNTSDPIDETEFEYSWNFDDGMLLDDNATPVNPYRYSQPGDKRVTLTVKNNAALGLCDVDVTKIISIPVEPINPDFMLSAFNICNGATVTVTNNTTGGANKFIWSVYDGEMNELFSRIDLVTPGDVDHSADFTFQANVPGIYTVKLEAINTFTQESEEIIKDDLLEIYENPNANFDFRPDVVFVPDQPLLTFNYSQGANEYMWNFGDGGSSTEFQPQHQYVYEGDFDVTLVAIANYGEKELEEGLFDVLYCFDTLTRTVEAKDGGYTKIPNAFTPSTLGPSPDGRIQNEVNNDIFLPITRGVEEFQMLIFDRWGNLIFESNDQTVGWDGYNSDNKLMPAGVYVYKLTLRLSNGERTTRIGDVMLIR